MISTAKKNILFYFLLVCIPLFSCLGLFEIYFRFIQPYNIKYVNIAGAIYPLYGLASRSHYTFDSETGYALIPNIHDEKQLITTNKYGFRTTGRTIDLNRESIIFVGDSTVFGWGVKDSSAFCYQIAQKKELEDFNIINMGVPSYSLGHINEVLIKKVPNFKPKIVFIAILWPWKPFSDYSTRDAWKEVDYEFYRKTIPLRTKYFNPRMLIRQIMPRSFFVVRDFVLRIKYRTQIKENLTRPGIRDFTISRADEMELAWEHINVLKSAVQELVKKGVKVIFYIHPYQYTVFHENYQNLGETGRKLMIDELGALSMRGYLRNKFSGEPLYIDGSHLTELGHGYYSEYFYAMLQNELNVDLKLSVPIK